MSDAIKKYSVRATDLLFAQMGGSFTLLRPDGPRAFRKGSPGRVKNGELVGKVEPLLEHALDLTAEEAAALARDGYDVAEKKSAETKTKKAGADQAPAEG